MRTIDKIITNVNCKFGSPLGRYNQGYRDQANRDGLPIFDCKVPLDSGGYDKGGCYWGLGKELRVSYTKDLSFISFYRVN